MKYILPSLLLALAPIVQAGTMPVACTPLPDCVALDGTLAQPNLVDKEGHVIRVTTPVVRLMRTTADKTKGTVLIFPSGGYHVLSVVSDGTDKAKFWNGLGYDAAILEYTISEKSWTRDDAIRNRALQDALASVRLVRGQAKELGLHDGAFVLMGGSAGGHLAARTVAALPEKERPDAVVLFYPAYLEEVPPGGKKAGMPLPGGKLPRLFVAIAANDNPAWVAGARAYAEGWNKSTDGTGRATFHLFDDGNHGFRKGSQAAAQWPELLTAFDAVTPLRVNKSIVPATQKGNGYNWMERHNAILKAKAEVNPDLIFIGDSITHFFGGEPASNKTPSDRHPRTGNKVLKTTLAGHRVLNLGFGSDRTQQVLWRLDHGELEGLKPRWVVIHIGTNNTSDGNNANEIMAGIQAVCGRVQKQTPGAKIILMAILPRDNPATCPRRKLIDSVNGLLADYAEQEHFTFLDLHAKFIDAKGTIPRSLMPDLCHPTEQGYQIWADALVPLLK